MRRAYNGYIVGEVECKEAFKGDQRGYESCMKGVIESKPSPYQPGNDPTTRWIGQTVNVGGYDIPILAIGGVIALVALLLILK